MTNMKLARTRMIGVAIALGSSLAVWAAPPNRPDPSKAIPLATCKLQMIAAPRPRVGGDAIPVMANEPVMANQLLNYERTPLGDWQMPAPADRSDPWVRLLLLAPKRPVVI